MTKEVIITIRGLQAGTGVDGEPIEMITTGEYYYRNNKHYLLYEEVVEGETAVNKNRIKVMPGYMELNKSGVVSVNMVFKEDEKNITHYYTPYGSLVMGIDAKSITVDEKEDSMRIEIDYGLEINQEHVADSNIKIMVQSKGCGTFKL
uniref:DUF1934 domain-containing protein n=1 Tax=Agathobacter sp. TaxID=2021311 RepID=UPI004055AB73